MTLDSADHRPDPADSPLGRSGVGRGTPRVHDADDMLAGGPLGLFVPGSRTCHLRLPRQGKLILNT